MSAQSFRHRHRVTYAECTLGNHVYYARYLDLLEEARGEFFRCIGLPLLELQADDTIFPVIESSLHYRAPARYDDVLVIELWLTELTRVRLGFGCRILNQTGRPIVEGRTVHVCTTLGEKPKRLPDRLLALLAPYHPAPDR
jgi:acyl-CoA thioester hydrolase